MKYSPLFWPIGLKGSSIYILDETALPQKIKYIKARNYQQAAKAIRQMKTRAVGQVLLVFYALLLSLRKKVPLKKVARVLNAARPTLPFKVLTDMVLDWQKQGLPLEKCILGFLNTLRQKRIRQAEQAAALINDGDCILTHCNVSGLMPLIGEFCRRQNKKISFYVTETRPYLQGMRLTAWELQRSGFAVTVICDNMVAEVMFEGKIDKVIVGADHMSQNGDIANKIGTYQIAILAKAFNIPFYVLCPPPSRLKCGSQIKIEVRPDKELLEFGGKRIAPAGVKGYYPAFDVTPAGFITKHIYLELSR
ncbi:MAG: S-methyl-5-thioribose-1-phosphate isomerase [Candidatus Omnitrophica bacterium]|nr:S-methyl-5-thioribose-1-phosphate isomerase [Candidatus Omnitrophota bacterium]